MTALKHISQAAPGIGKLARYYLPEGIQAVNAASNLSTARVQL